MGFNFKCKVVIFQANTPTYISYSDICHVTNTSTVCCAVDTH